MDGLSAHLQRQNSLTDWFRKAVAQLFRSAVALRGGCAICRLRNSVAKLKHFYAQYA
jgi:hypothetical protein